MILRVDRWPITSTTRGMWIGRRTRTIKGPSLYECLCVCLRERGREKEKKREKFGCKFGHFGLTKNWQTLPFSHSRIILSSFTHLQLTSSIHHPQGATTLRSIHNNYPSLLLDAYLAANWTRLYLTGQHTPFILNDEYSSGPNSGLCQKSGCV